MRKYAGLGLSQVFVLFVVISLMRLGAKIILGKYRIPGLSEIVFAW